MKYLSLILLAMLMLASCSQPAGDTDENIAVVKNMFEAFNKHDWAKMAECYADTADFLDPSFGTGYVKRTRPETAKKYAELQQMLPDIRDSIATITATGDKVVVEFVSFGTITGPAPGSEKIKMVLPICSVLTIKDGKIIKDATYYDNQ